MLAVELKRISDAHLRITFNLFRGQKVKVEFDVRYLQDGYQVQNRLAEIEKTIDNCRYCVPVCGDCAECEWYQVMTIVNNCKEEALNIVGELMVQLRINGVTEYAYTKKAQPVSVPATAISSTRVASAA